jgi:hypothetical protein
MAWPPSFPSVAHLARHTRHFAGERSQLVHHGVDGFFELQDLASNVYGDFSGEVAVGNSDGHIGDVADLRREVVRHGVDAIGQGLSRRR